MNLEKQFKRENGHLIIGKDNWNNLARNITSSSFVLNIDSRKYYVKNRNYDKAIMNLIVNELAKFIGIDVALEDICKIDNHDFFTKILSKSVKKDNFNYLDMYDILNEYNNYINKKGIGFFEQYNVNNLENIWASLDYHYKDYPNRKIIVKKIMKQIVRLFCFDVITGEVDRHFYNYMIAENEDTAFLAPIFDNEYAYGKESRIYHGIAVENNDSSDGLEELHSFLAISDQSFRKVFDNIYNTITETTFLLAILRVEQKLGIVLEREKYLELFRCQKEKLDKLLKEEEYER